MVRLRPTAALCLALAGTLHPMLASAAGDWLTTLEGIDLEPEKPGFEAFYDTRLGITWLADVGAVQGTRYAWTDPSHGHVSTPLAEFDNAQRWLARARFGDVGGWRLPSPAEFGSMFFQTLGHSGNVLQERGPFMNLGSYPADDGNTGRYVWTNETWGNIITTFGMEGYGWNTALSGNPMIPWPVHDGRVQPPPRVAGRADWAQLPYAVRCRNGRTGQEVTIEQVVRPGYDCRRAGLLAISGDPVSVTITGTLR
ncbi:MAG: hypothetical protein J0M20_18590 [Burkholderiales bacterium]|nr:hypothetical protein [Burkholderiales bacterium]